MYLDSAYIAKYYLNEPDAPLVRQLIRTTNTPLQSSALALAEVTCVFHRHVREGALSVAQGRRLIDLFRTHADAGIWNLHPITGVILEQTAALVRSLPKSVPLRAGDAIHLASARHADEPVIWTNDRHLLAAAQHAGLTGRSVGS